MTNPFFTITREQYWKMQYKRGAEDRFDLIRIVAKFLEHRLILFRHDIDRLIIYPRDQYEMMEVVAHFGFYDIAYFDGQKTQILFPKIHSHYGYRAFSPVDMHFRQSIAIPRRKPKPPEASQPTLPLEAPIFYIYTPPSSLKLFDTGLAGVQGSLLR